MWSIDPVIAIGAQIATSGATAKPSSPNVSAGESNMATAPFSAVLAQAQTPLSDAVATPCPGDASGQAVHPSMSASSKREPKVSDAKLPDSKALEPKAGSRKEQEKDSEAGLNANPAVQDKGTPANPAQLPPVSVLPWNFAVQDFAIDPTVPPVHASGESDPKNSTSDSKVTSSSGSPATSPEASDAIQKSTGSPASSDDAVESTDLQFPLATDDRAGDTAEAASETKAVVDSAASNAKLQPVSVLAALSQSHGAPHGMAESTISANKAQVAIKSAIEQAVALPAVVPPAVVPPATIFVAPESNEVGASGSLATKINQVDKSKISASQENGATGKNVEVAGDAKTQSHKDEAASSAGPLTAAAAGIPAAKSIDPTPSFAVAGIQLANSGEAGKSGVAVAQNTGDPQAAQLEQKSTGVAANSAQAESVAAYPASQIHSAKLIQSIGEAELRLGVRSGEFGSVDIRTSMVRNQFSAEISVERGELGRVMAAELPNLQNRLTEQRVPVANITLQNHTGSSSTASEQQRSRDRQEAYSANPLNAGQEVLTAPLVAAEGIMPASRLDIHM